MSIRSERVSAELQRALMEAITQHPTQFSDGLVTITHVRVADDLKSARVYISILGGKIPHKRTIDRLNAATPQLRHSLGRKIKLKYSPGLFFYLDDTLDEIEHIESLFRQIHDEQGGTAAGAEK